MSPSAAPARAQKTFTSNVRTSGEVAGSASQARKLGPGLAAYNRNPLTLRSPAWGTCVLI